MASGDHSPEYMIFRLNFDIIAAEISPVLQEFATKSFQKNLISRDNLRQSCNERLELTDRSARLLQILLDAISVDSSKFHEIIGIMKSLPELEHLADILQHDVSLYEVNWLYRGVISIEWFICGSDKTVWYG